MALRRYARSNIIGANRQYGTSRAIQAIRDGIEIGTVRFTTSRTLQGQRLDSIAGEVYNNGRLWWVIAAASEIGWALQVPPETIIRIPNITDIASIIG
jgi:nucleoid-associated protein YgaU